MVSDFRTCVTRQRHQALVRIQQIFHPCHTAVFNQQLVVAGCTEIVGLAQALVEGGRSLFGAVVDVVQQEVDVTDNVVFNQVSGITQSRLTGQTCVDDGTNQVIAVQVCKSDTGGVSHIGGLSFDDCVRDASAA